MDGSVDIRMAGEGDFDALTDLWERSARSSHAFMDDDEFAEQRPRIRDLLLPSMDVWVAEQDGEPLGFVGARDGGVELLYISPGAQGRGLGTTLLSYISGGAGPASVEVFADNETGVGFYRSRGFVEAERYAVAVGGRSVDIVRLRRAAP
jgi:ribosomal protein S18 acetylase RimI-like enzyme